MKGKDKKEECRDIGGTVCIPIAYLAYLGRAKCSAYLTHTWPFFIAHVKDVVIAKIIKKTERCIERFFSSHLNLPDLNRIEFYLCKSKIVVLQS